jgi:hypothetical protein
LEGGEQKKIQIPHFSRKIRPGMMTYAWHDGFAGLVVRLVVK